MERPLKLSKKLMYCKRFLELKLRGKKYLIKQPSNVVFVTRFKMEKCKH